MSNEKKSCLKRVAIGCGGFLAVFVFFGVLLVISAYKNKPQPREEVSLNTVQTFETALEGGLNLPQSPKSNKPVHLVFDVSMAQLSVVPNDQAGKIEVSGDYDKANYELTTRVDEKPEYIEYHISFKNKRSLLGMALSGIHGETQSGDRNRLKVTLPRDLLLDIKTTTKMGDFNYDFSGLALNSLNMDMSMGNHEVYMDEPNQVTMKFARIRADKGNDEVYDFQNFRFEKAEIIHKMGELKVRSSGPLTQDTVLHVAAKMGETHIMIPENARLDSSASAFMGETRITDKEPPANADIKELKLSGGVTMGGYLVQRRKAGSKDGIDPIRTIRREGIEGRIQELRTAFEEDPSSDEVEPNEINRLGYDLVAHRMNREALEVFKLNTELNPDYANGFDSLGEHYRRMKMLDLALENYKKALEMDPENARILRRISRIEQRIAQLNRGEKPDEDEMDDPDFESHDSTVQE